MSESSQANLPFSPVQNINLFSNHWLEHRLPDEPEWAELRAEAEETLDRIAATWKEQRELVSHYNESQLEDDWIHPVLEQLGWPYLYQTHIRGRKPDYALFDNVEDRNTAVKLGRTEPAFWDYPRIVADAKAWPVKLDRPTRINGTREYPPEQIEWYLDKTRLDYGILTNGRLWQLIPREKSADQPRFQTFLECDLPRILDAWIGAHQEDEMPLPYDEERQNLLDDFLTFYLFFNPRAYREIDDRKPLIIRAIEGSSEYRIGVGEGLKSRVFDALGFAIEGFLAHKPNNLKADEHLEAARENAFILLYRILFILYAEDRLLLPHPPNNLYRKNRSLHRHRDEIATQIDRHAKGRADDFSRNDTGYWEDLKSLFDLVNSGNRRYQVPAYNGGLFNPELHPFLETNALSDWYIAHIIDKLGRTHDPERPQRGLSRIDYRDLAIQHLGSVYEGLLELQPHFASEPLIVVRHKKKSEERVIPAADPLPRGFEPTEQTYEPGQVYLLTDKGERRASGSYYTPNHIVDYIVEQTLGPLCEEIDHTLSKEIETAASERKRARGERRTALEETLTRLRSDYDDRVLNLNVLDPAMGSGHFLIRACQYLAEQIATNPNTGDEQADRISEDESVLTFWKRRVVERCIYGVDLNPMAVELAQLALWLETVAVGQPLSFVAHHLRHGNSLIGAEVERLGALPGAFEVQKNIYQQRVEASLPILLEPLEEIRKIPSDNADDIKKKERLYSQVFDKRRFPFLKIADLWIASYFADEDNAVDTQQYQQAVEEIDKPRRFQKLLKEPWFKRALAVAARTDVSPFHWELEFPGIYFDKTGRKPNAGFDAVIGNPPYDVLSSKELGRDISDFKTYIKDQKVYDPSRRGKNNLYKLFVCKSFDLLKNQGRIGQITPMALLGDDQARHIRMLIMETGAFASIDAFPQKDDPKQRVFPEAKLSTVVITALRAAHQEFNTRPFVSQVHPGRYIEQDSPRLRLSASEIPLYDPENVAIVSCDQADWDVVTRIFRSQRLGRLHEHCESFQGEVNETNERPRGAISSDPYEGPEILRGSAVCLYTLRAASQGDRLHLVRDAFLEGKSSNSKAHAYRERRLGFQRSSPQNNFRRIIAAVIPVNSFCFDTVSFVPESSAKSSIEFLMALLNSKLLDWYFRLGSTNSKVNEYQFNNLPSPIFSSGTSVADNNLLKSAIAARRRGELDECFAILEPAMAEPPFSPIIQDFIVELVNRIIQIEKGRGEIARSERSHLDPKAQPYQDLIDRIFFRLAGLSDEEAAALEDRLSRML